MSHTYCPLAAIWPPRKQGEKGAIKERGHTRRAAAVRPRGQKSSAV